MTRNVATRIAQAFNAFAYHRACRDLERDRPARAIRHLRRAAAGGHREAQDKLGEVYSSGRGVIRSQSEAAFWLRKAAEAGSVTAQFRLARLLLDESGRGVPGSSLWLSSPDHARRTATVLFPHGTSIGKDEREACRWLRAAAEGGSIQAKAQLAWLLESGTAIERDSLTAFRLFTEAANEGLDEANFGLGRAFEFGRGTPLDPIRAVDAYTVAAKAGHVAARFRVGLAYRDGWGVGMDRAAALRHLEIAAEAGHPQAQFECASLILVTAPAERDVELAENLLRRAARQDNRPSLMMLATLFTRGDRLAADPREAAIFYVRAAELGEREAQFIAGRLCACGEGLPKNLKNAASWFRRAAEKGHGLAAYNLGLLHAKGLGVALDPAAALDWYRCAAEAGFAEGQLIYGRLLLSAAATEDAQHAAKAWIERAAVQGNLEAQTLLADVMLHQDGTDARARANDLLRNAARQGYGPALRKLNRLHLAGGTLMSQDDFLSIMRKAATAESAEAQFALAVHLSNQGEEAHADAALWCRRAADHGHVGAAYLTGVFLCQGRGVAKDFTEACCWYKRASESGHALAQFNLAMMLFNGWGCESDTKAARDWLAKAASSNLREAVNFLGKIEAGQPTRTELNIST